MGVCCRPTQNCAVRHNPGVMSALGQKQTLECLRAMSALPPKADIAERSRDVRFVPKADSCSAAKKVAIRLLRRLLARLLAPDVRLLQTPAGSLKKGARDEPTRSGVFRSQSSGRHLGKTCSLAASTHPRLSATAKHFHSGSKGGGVIQCASQYKCHAR